MEIKVHKIGETAWTVRGQYRDGSGIGFIDYTFKYEQHARNLYNTFLTLSHPGHEIEVRLIKTKVVETNGK